MNPCTWPDMTEIDEVLRVGHCGSSERYSWSSRMARRSSATLRSPYNAACWMRYLERDLVGFLERVFLSMLAVVNAESCILQSMRE